MSASPGELINGFLVGAYLLSFVDIPNVIQIKNLGIRGRWNDKFIDGLVEQGYIEANEHGEFFEDSYLTITESGKEKAMSLIFEPGERVPESVFLEWRYNYIDDFGDGGHPTFDKSAIPPALFERMKDWEEVYQEHYVRPRQQAGHPFVGSDQLVDRDAVESSDWTGILSARQRLSVVKTLIPPALEALEGLIHNLESPRHNGGPPLEEDEELLNCLKSLHSALGEVLTLAEQGKLESDEAGGMIAAVVDYAHRFGKLAKNEPVKVGVAGLAAGIGLLAGFPAVAIGATVTIAMQVKKE